MSGAESFATRPLMASGFRSDDIQLRARNAAPRALNNLDALA